LCIIVIVTGCPGSVPFSKTIDEAIPRLDGAVQQKVASASLLNKRRCFKTANIKIVSANSTQEASRHIYFS